MPERKYEISEEERKRRSERMAAQNRERAEERRKARERGEELPAKKPEPPIDFNEAWEAKLRSILENPKATPKQILDAESAIEKRERARKERQRSAIRREELLEAALESHRKSAPPFEAQVVRWREIAAEHGLELNLSPFDETHEIPAELAAPEPAPEPEPASEPEPQPKPEALDDLDDIDEPPAPEPPAEQPTSSGNVVKWPVGPGEDPYAGLGSVGRGTPKGTGARGGYDRQVDSTLGARPY